MPHPMKVIAENLGHNKDRWWVRIPNEGGTSWVGLTLPRSELKHGFAGFKHLRVAVDYDTLRHDGSHYVASLTIEKGLD